ncbi:transmembrane protein, putative (macronuclear) [Tetrahymena thermophila SB210]|uniref:Transmembrane protein, putative n=1 Tax=Tetrahymena thermophila (strain SB210) TaxID=312017 RepID=W7XGE9_TETTS|nr:transmembrane protein, putative [Tetrahymena thermophila SB210]EWS73201.1 transmembrane protein, putative [Tetrahymena thermophila SB210]|eukprot:XP_012654277.1 transmembrane protein, putative [Tetrahymena thermophila SB210]
MLFHSEMIKHFYLILSQQLCYQMHQMVLPLLKLNDEQSQLYYSIYYLGQVKISYYFQQLMTFNFLANTPTHFTIVVAHLKQINLFYSIPFIQLINMLRQLLNYYLDYEVHLEYFIFDLQWCFNSLILNIQTMEKQRDQIKHPQKEKNNFSRQIIQYLGYLNSLQNCKYLPFKRDSFQTIQFFYANFKGFKPILQRHYYFQVFKCQYFEQGISKEVHSSANSKYVYSNQLIAYQCYRAHFRFQYNSFLKQFDFLTNFSIIYYSNFFRLFGLFYYQIFHQSFFSFYSFLLVCMNNFTKLSNLEN